MSNGSPPSPPRSPGGTALIVLSVFVPTCFAGWLGWQAIGGTDDGRAKEAVSRPSAAARTDGRTPEGGEVKPSRQAPSAGASRPGPDKSRGGTGSGGGDGAGQRGDSPAPDGPLAGKVVVVDPGHNLHNRDHTGEIAESVDIGTHRKECDTTGAATNSGYSEAAFALDVSRRIRTLLADRGATVKMTQDNDRPYGPCVDERARIGNKAKADAVVSVHADGSVTGNRGFHVILPASVRGGDADTSGIVKPSRELGERIAGMFVRETGSRPSNYIGGGTGLDVRSDLGGLNLSTVPKVFIECGNMRDPDDAADLTSSKWRQNAARGIANGIEDFLKK
ncbi:N-acetylmuramoyl-L-alanine amidase [Streptomyces sp. bgisy100]|uniref:N-acetylmuramoyl-L-alanine amidase n=1 Tax=Streptomyces sp. bgisy100 TaxID=3413783 RepID=UPI003D756B89